MSFPDCDFDWVLLGVGLPASQGGTPRIGAGVIWRKHTVSGPFEDLQWVEQILELEPADEFGGFISPARYQDQRLCRELSLELIAEEPSLNQQAALIADFVSRTFQLLEDNPPAAS